MKFIWPYLKRYRKLLFGALALATVNQVFSLTDPLIFRYTIDNFALKINELPTDAFVKGVLLLLAASVGVALISRIAKNFQAYYVNVITQRLGASLYANSVSHSFNLPYEAFEDQRSGELLQKLEKAKDDNQQLVQLFINTVFFSMVGILFVLVYAYFVHWTVGTLYVLMIPALGSVAFYISRKIKKIQMEIVREQAGLAGSTTETLRNVQLVKSLGLKDQEINRLNNVNEKILALELKKVQLVRRLDFTQGTIINALRTTLLFVMLYLLYVQTMSIGQLFSLFTYSFFIFTPLAQFGEFITKYRETQASNDQLKSILDIKPEEKPTTIKKLSELENVEFKNVSFKYSSGPEHSLKNINVHIKAGQTIAFVGPSGSGKSTLIKLLVGLYKPTDGDIFFNNISVQNIDFEELRRKIGFVAQEVQLFAGSIRENLLFVNPKASDQDCMQAIRAAAAETILERGGNGLDTKIGEGGIKLSGGERQRLAIARALLREPELIIFDEATSSLDSITEESITNTIKNIEKTHPDLMRVLVAHRLSTVMHADIIYVLQSGEIIEHGTHSHLLSKKGLYAALWRQQVGNEK